MATGLCVVPKEMTGECWCKHSPSSSTGLFPYFPNISELGNSLASTGDVITDMWEMVLILRTKPDLVFSECILSFGKSLSCSSSHFDLQPHSQSQVSGECISSSHTQEHVDKLQAPEAMGLLSFS